MIYLIIGLLIIIAITVFEFRKNNKIKKLPSRPDTSKGDIEQTRILEANIHELVTKLENNQALDKSDYDVIEAVCVYIDNRYDCLDFRMQSIIRILYNHSEKIEASALNRMKNTLLNAKYYMDQVGEDSICYWSENHLLLFAVAEYLTGQLYEEEIFTNDGLSGKEHKKLAKERLMIWLEQRFKYGFVEWYSNTYYEEDIAPLANIIEFCDDKKIVERAKMVLDLLLFDIATQSYKGSFTSTSGRQYEEGKKSGKDSALSNVTKHVWGYDSFEKSAGLDQCFIYMKGYEVPNVIKAIGKDHSPNVIKASTGLNLNELLKEYPESFSLGRVMMQWSMEAFSNAEIITSAMKYIHKHKMLSNEFMNGFKLINLSILKYLGLLPLVSKILRPSTNGSAIQRANTYTYRTDSYMLSTTQSYHPGDFGDQQHIWSATLASDLCVFTTHPALPLSDDGALSISPGYWVGNGRNPHSVQNNNVNITMYVIDGKKGFMESSLEKESHCYFPVNKFDKVEVLNKTVFGVKDNTYIGIRTLNDIKQLDDELIQRGELTVWVTEMGDANTETFEEFKDRVLSNTLEVDSNELKLVYKSKENHQLTYQGEYTVNNKVINTEYKRFDSIYSTTERKSNKILIKFGEHELELDFDKGIRKHF